MENNCFTIGKSFDIQLLEQTHLASKKKKTSMQNFGAGHWDFEYPTLMEVKNYM